MKVPNTGTVAPPQTVLGIKTWSTRAALLVVPAVVSMLLTTSGKLFSDLPLGPMVSLQLLRSGTLTTIA